MTTLQSKPLLTKADLPLAEIAEICRRWHVHEMAVDTVQTVPLIRHAPWLEPDPFADVDLYLIVKFGSDRYEWRFNVACEEALGVEGSLMGRAVLDNRLRLRWNTGGVCVCLTENGKEITSSVE